MLNWLSKTTFSMRPLERINCSSFSILLLLLAVKAPAIKSSGRRLFFSPLTRISVDAEYLGVARRKYRYAPPMKTPKEIKKSGQYARYFLITSFMLGLLLLSEDSPNTSLSI